MDQRANRMKTLIINTFFDCLETLDFTQITIGKISDQAMINRSTFYPFCKLLLLYHTNTKKR